MLAAWAASPARFREDANAEEALAVGGYAGRVLVELASNAVDAAREIGVPARIRVRLHTADQGGAGQGGAGQDGAEPDGVDPVSDDPDSVELRVANTGAPLTAAGVSALASLRASPKRDTTDSVGHFGVGFTAVLSWSQRPVVVSTTGGVRFDTADTRAEIAALNSAALDQEVLRRSGQVPVLRLPWPVEQAGEQPPEGYATEIRLPLGPAARAEVEQLLADPGTAEDLFWALTDLAEIDLPDRVVRCGRDESGLTVIHDGQRTRRYRTAGRSGDLPSALLAGRPVEERGRSRWRVAWALPADPPDTAADDLTSVARAMAGSTFRRIERTTIGAPTPTDEPLTLPARLIGTFPVDDTRRRLANGPLADYLLEQAADSYLELVAGTDPADRWSLMPGGGFPAGPIDGALQAAVLRRVAVTPLLITAVGDPVTPPAACLLPGLGDDGAALFGQAIPGLLPSCGAAAEQVLRGLGVQMLQWSQASSALAGIDRDPDFWFQVYEAVAGADRPPVAEDLADIPVPLAGGRRAIGARGCLLPAPAADGLVGSRIDSDLALRVGALIPSLRIVDPAAAHPLLERLGARPADPDALLADPAVVATIEDMRRELEDDEPNSADVTELATVVLDLLAAGGRAGRAGDGVTATAEGPAVLGEVVLTDLEGQPWPASELLMPGAALAAVLAADADRPVVGARWTDRYPADVLVAAGVRAGFAVVTVNDQQGAGVDLPDVDEWLERAELEPGGSFNALADLDLVDPDCWEPALQLIAADRSARACLLPSPGGLSYSGWWLSRHARIGGRPPEEWRLPAAADLAGLYDPVPMALDPLIARAIGVRTGLTQAASDDPVGLLERLADPSRTVSPARVTALTAAVVAALADDEDVDLPLGVRTLSGDVVDAADACVLDEPWLAQILPARRLVPGGADAALVARVLDLPAASAQMRVSVLGDGDESVVGTRQAVARESGQARADGGESVNWEPILRRLDRAAAAVGLRREDFDVTVSPTLRVAINDHDPVPVRWWGAHNRYWTDGSAAAAGRVVAWASGRWSERHRIIAAALDDAVALAEDGLGAIERA